VLNLFTVQYHICLNDQQDAHFFLLIYSD